MVRSLNMSLAGLVPTGRAGGGACWGGRVRGLDPLRVRLPPSGRLVQEGREALPGADDGGERSEEPLRMARLRC
jgi:hypothetical protein